MAGVTADFLAEVVAALEVDFPGEIDAGSADWCFPEVVAELVAGLADSPAMRCEL